MFRATFQVNECVRGVGGGVGGGEFGGYQGLQLVVYGPRSYLKY